MARRCLEIAARHLLPGGVMLLQLGNADQVADLANTMATEHPGLTVEEVRRPAPNGVVVLVRRQDPA